MSPPHHRLDVLQAGGADALKVARADLPVVEHARALVLGELVVVRVRLHPLVHRALHKRRVERLVAEAAREEVELPARVGAGEEVEGRGAAVAVPPHVARARPPLVKVAQAEAVRVNGAGRQRERVKLTLGPVPLRVAGVTLGDGMAERGEQGVVRVSRRRVARDQQALAARAAGSLARGIVAVGADAGGGRVESVHRPALKVQRPVHVILRRGAPGRRDLPVAPARRDAVAPRWTPLVEGAGAVELVAPAAEAAVAGTVSTLPEQHLPRGWHEVAARR
mmetsp:Transcript_51450/g.170491  ORF Transcript_51450/g.170491 Transcript_51450/m.170491 type:complete len:279 (-) Transcript_51450:57-893(-)